MRELKVNGFYKHFKGDIYQVLELATHTEDNSSLVIYKSIETFKVFARSLDMFMSEVDAKKYPQATQRYRFEEYEVNSSSLAIIPKDFDKWNLIDIHIDVPNIEINKNSNPINYLTKCLISELIACAYIPITSGPRLTNNSTEFRLRFPIGPWMATLK